MYISFLLLTIFLIVAMIFAMIKTHRIGHFLLVSVLILFAGFFLDFVAGLVGNLITGDFHVAAFYWQLFPFGTAGVWLTSAVIGVVVMFIKEPR